MLLTDLNNDCLEEITKYLGIEDFIKFSKVNKEINQLIEQR